MHVSATADGGGAAHRHDGRHGLRRASAPGWTTVAAGRSSCSRRAIPAATGRAVDLRRRAPATTLTASPGTWTATGPLAHAYQWQRCDAAGASCEVIAGATGTSYQVLEAIAASACGSSCPRGNWISSVGQEDSLPTAAVGDPVTPPPPVTGGGGGSGGSGSTSGGSGGQTGGGSQGGQAATAPRLTGLAISPKRFAVRKSATIRWTLDRAASLSVRVERVLKGRKVGIRCRPDSKRLRKRSPCTRYVSMGTIKRAAKKGTGTLKLAGKVGAPHPAARQLPAGRERHGCEEQPLRAADADLHGRAPLTPESAWNAGAGPGRDDRPGALPRGPGRAGDGPCGGRRPLIARDMEGAQSPPR